MEINKGEGLLTFYSRLNPGLFMPDRDFQYIGEGGVEWDSFYFSLLAYFKTESQNF